jgi:hypothetical protein
MMLNLKKIFLEAEKKNEKENFVHSVIDAFFRKNESLLVFRIFSRGVQLTLMSAHMSVSENRERS